MKLTVGDLEAYSYCPWLQKDGDKPFIQRPYSHEAIKSICDVTTYIVGRQLESGRVPAWSVWANKWIRTYWKDRILEDKSNTALSDGCTLILTELYQMLTQVEATPAMVNFEFELRLNDNRDHVRSTIPLVHITKDEQVELTFLDSPYRENEFRRDLIVRLGVMAVTQAMPDNKISCIRGVSMDIPNFRTKIHTLYPNEAFIENCLSDIVGLVVSIKNDVRYANRLGCHKCEIGGKCKR